MSTSTTAHTAKRTPAAIIAEFNSTVTALLKRVEMKSRSETEIAHLDRLRKRISLLKSTVGDHALIAESNSFFIEYSEKILEPDAAKRDAFFLNMDIRAEYLSKGRVIKKDDEFIFALTDSVRDHYKKVSTKEKAAIYAEVNTLLSCALEYELK
jgi:hypothetical protein